MGARVRRLWNVCWGLSVLVLAFKASAQRYPFFNIGIEQGLIQSQVSSLVQDKQGHLWAGTLGGISCFDGHTFRSFTKRDGLPSNEVSALACDTQGNIWIGTSNGLSKFDGYRFTNYSLSGPDNPMGNQIMHVLVHGEDIYASSFRLLTKLHNGKLEMIQLPRENAMPSGLVFDAIGDKTIMLLA